MNVNYTMEELMPVFEKLAKKYAGYDSTSITYEKAEQLMEAILYCIREIRLWEQNALPAAQSLSPGKAYEAGFACVKKKTEEALKMYNRIMEDFIYCENRCLYDTVAKGMPVFFQRYDIGYDPQNTILTLDYPVLEDLTGFEGADRIYEYLKCIGMEQKFLHLFPEDYSVSVLRKYSSSYRDMVENICEIVLTDALLHILVGKNLRDSEFGELDCLRIQNFLDKTELNEVRTQLKTAAVKFLEMYCEEGEEISQYLERAADNIAVRLKNAAENGALNGMLRVNQ